MAEYIEREAAIKRFNFAVLDCLGMEPTIRAGDIIKALESIPDANVRPVVLCRDCKWAKTDEMDDPAIYCMQWDRWETPPDGFCCLGEKREES